MTNILYFSGIVRDDASTTSSSDVSLLQHQSDGQASSSSSSLYSVIRKSFHALIPRKSGLNPKESSDDAKDYESCGIILSASLFPSPEKLESGNMKVFSFQELKNATRNFHPEVLLRESAFGRVFKGWIDINTLTATKPGKGIAVIIKILDSEGFEGHNEWLVSVMPYREQLCMVELYYLCASHG